MRTLILAAAAALALPAAASAQSSPTFPEEMDDDIASRWGPRVVDLLRTAVEAAKAAAPPKAA